MKKNFSVSVISIGGGGSGGTVGYSAFDTVVLPGRFDDTSGYPLEDELPIVPRVKCAYCGQFAARFYKCPHCGAPVE